MKWTYYGTAGKHNAATIPYQPKTQKVKGLYALYKQCAYGFPHFSIPNQVLPLGVEESEITVDYPTFARPCPLTPRHGFVDSRKVKNWEELKEVIEETKAADPNGEVMLCGYISSTHNSVWVPTLLTVGEGNDGATAGKDTITFPLNGIMDARVFASLEDAGVGKGQDPYIEAVYYDAAPHYSVTQLRAGPRLKVGLIDYLPTTLEVKKVIKVVTSDSLLEWEEKMEKVKDEEGVVVWHPGGSPTDHFSVHARTFSIPVCVTFEPIVGETIHEDTSTPVLSPMGVLEGISIGDQFTLHHDNQPDGGRAINLVLHTLHHSSAIGGDQSWWLGVGVAFMLRYGAIALRGEARHINHPMKERNSVYKAALPHNLNRQRMAIPALINILRYGNFGGAVGGIKWARCGQATAKLFDAVGVLAKKKDQESVNEVVRALNFAVNQAHNGGWWLNKFTSTNAFTEVQKGSLHYTLDLAPMLWRLKEAREKFSLSAMNQSVAKWAKWTVPLSLAPVPLTAADLITVPGVNGLGIKVENRLLKKNHKPLLIEIPTLIKHFPAMIKGKLYVETTEDGLQLLLLSPHEEPLVLWKEAGIVEVK